MIYYIWTEDKFTLQIKEALIERAKAGIEVRCLYDESGGMMSKQYPQDLKDAGVEIYPYLKFRKLGKLHTVNYRSHRKIAIQRSIRGNSPYHRCKTLRWPLQQSYALRRFRRCV